MTENKPPERQFAQHNKPMGAVIAMNCPGREVNKQSAGNLQRSRKQPADPGSGPD